MAFGHGKNTKVYCNGYNITGYLSSIETPKIADTAETSTFGSTSKSYVAGQVDATLSSEGFFDGSSNAVDEVLENILGSESVEWSWYPQGDTRGNYGYAMQTINTAYNVMSTFDDAAKISVEAQSIVGRERVASLHALAQITTTLTGTAVNNGSSSANGGSAYLHVTQATGTIEIKIQHSADNFSADTEDLVSFTNVTDVTSERVTIAGTIKQYTRAHVTLAGGESITFNMSIHRS